MNKKTVLILITPLLFSIAAGWFAWRSYSQAPEIASENLKSAALTISSSIEKIASADDNFTPLSNFSSPDIAYYLIYNAKGEILFHTNRSLVGEIKEDISEIERAKAFNERRKRLGTGEEVYLINTEIHPNGKKLYLELALHTYRADLVIRRSSAGVTILLFLSVTLWIFTAALLYSFKKIEKGEKDMRRREELAKLGEMSAVMAHEIRNPLAGIKGFSQLIETSQSIEEAKIYAEKVVSQSIKMEELVNDLLSFAREDSAEKRTEDIGKIAEDAVIMAFMELKPENITVEKSISKSITANCNQQRIFQLILNLIKNAIQAMPDGGILKVSAETIANNAVIKIEDSGVGIQKEKLSKIFDPFFTTKAKGTGLGLALCRKIAEEHSGRLAVESVEKLGTNFTLTISRG